MSYEAWLIFTGFWVLFVTTPGPNAVNCIGNGMAHGMAKSLWGVAAILTQSLIFQFLSAAGITAIIAASPTLFFWLKLAGAGFLIWLGIRGWLNARTPVAARPTSARSIYGRAFLIATINAKSVAGYIAAFSQFIEPGVPVWTQMWLIVPTALTITALSYTGYTALGAWLGRRALGAVMHVRVRQGMAICFMIYGALLGVSGLSDRPA